MRFFGGDVANVSRLKSPPSVKLIGQGDVAMNTRLLIAAVKVFSPALLMDYLRRPRGLGKRRVSKRLPRAPAPRFAAASDCRNNRHL